MIVNALIDDIESSSRQGTVRERPANPSFAPGPVVVELLEDEQAGWLARANTEVVRNGTAVLHRQEPFELFV